MAINFKWAKDPGVTEKPGDQKQQTGWAFKEVINFKHLNWMFMTIFDFAKGVSTTPIGSVTAYVGAAAPDKWLICDGSTFDAEVYPELNTLLGGNTLPDLRGEFIRGLDNNRGVDAGRTLLSKQSDDNKKHDHTRGTMEIEGAFTLGQDRYGGSITKSPSGAFYVGASGSARYIETIDGKTAYRNYFKASRAWTGKTSSNGSEARPRNVAMNYIVKAK